MRCQILLNDGSLNEDTGKVCHLPVTIFADAMRESQEPLLFKKLRSAAEGNTAMAFFGIQGKRSEAKQSGAGSGKWSFTSPFGFFCESASDTSRGKELEAQAVELSVLRSWNMEQNEDFANAEAIETTCALLKSIMADTKVQAIETETTFW